MREDLKARRKILSNRLADLTQRLHSIETELEAPHPRDWDEQAVEREDEEVLEGLGKAGEAEIACIREALRRMDRGEYGVCTVCGEEISDDRLDVLPFTPHCRSCARSVS